MNSENVNALSTSVIAFVTIIGFMVALYYNLKSSNIGIIYIVVFELIFIFVIFLLILGLKEVLRNV